ncbi:MAG TPA: hypothetical protein PKG74_01900 [Candidatus Colwellbacteria bacterium]|nr:hypothetical protein [Candidatus Colwellbacteria bacterium]
MITLSCQACHGTIARDIELEVGSPTTIVLKMMIKCSHCGHPNRITIRTKLEKEILIDGRILEPGKGESGESIRSLS